MSSANASNPSRHWADRVADDVVASGRPPVISTGISPSGEIHIGNMREILTADAVFRVLRERQVPVRFNFVADNFDPLRAKTFLDQETFGPLAGRPLSDIRCPCGEHGSFDEHYLEPFLEALERLGVAVEVERADQMYRSGRMNPWILLALEARDRIAAIFKELSGKQVAPEWSPFTPLCEACGRMTDARVVGFSRETESVDYACACGSTGSRSIAGGGKLRWQVDWPARWMMLGVTVEPFGKDHATKGGSYDSGKRIVREVFRGEPPLPIPYEWISRKGQGDMSSSRGNVLSIHGMLEVVPPEVLRYLVIRARPQKAIKFDPGEPLLQLVDEIDDPESTARDARAVELSRAGQFEPVGVPFKHLVVVAQASGFDERQTVEILARTGYASVSIAALRDRLAYANRWLARFAPDHLRFEVKRELPPEVAELTGEQRRFLSILGSRLTDGMDGPAIHDLIWEVARGIEEAKPAQLFQAIYVALLGKERGPRAGWFLAVVGPGFSARRFAAASAADGSG